MTETTQPGQYAFQPGVFQGIVTGHDDTWFVGNTTATVEEVDEGDWWTEDVGTATGSTPTGVQMFAISDETPNSETIARTQPVVKGSKLFFPSWKIEDMRENKDGETFLVRTRMATAPGVALLVDPGSPENLCGDQWSTEMQNAALAANRPPIKYSDLARPLEVGGIGSGTQSAYQSGQHCIGLADGTDAIFESPILPKSGTPALLGQKSLKKMRCLLDCFNNKLYRVGPGGYKIQLSPGSVIYPLEESHAGHLMLPCSRFSRHANQHEEVQIFTTEEDEAKPETRFSCEGRRGAAKL